MKKSINAACASLCQDSHGMHNVKSRCGNKHQVDFLMWNMCFVGHWEPEQMETLAQGYEWSQERCDTFRGKFLLQSTLACFVIHTHTHSHAIESVKLTRIANCSAKVNSRKFDGISFETTVYCFTWITPKKKVFYTPQLEINKPFRLTWVLKLMCKNCRRRRTCSISRKARSWALD